MNGEPITHRNIEAALKRLSMKKSPGTDDITAEMLVAAGQNGLAELVKLSNMIYDKDCFPGKLNLQSITFSKVTRTVKCDKHRTISLISTKLLLQVIMNRISNTSGSCPITVGIHAR